MRPAYEGRQFAPKVSCRFGDFEGEIGARLNGTLSECHKPAFPTGERERIGEYTVTYSANGQCFPPQSASNATFRSYNSQINGISVSGAPSTSSITLEIECEGLLVPPLPEAICRLTKVGAAEGDRPFISPLTVLSATEARCATPASGSVASWEVEVLQNGVHVDPALFGAILFKEYDIGSVRVSSVHPVGGPIGVATALTVHGTGFAQYGEGMVVCRIGSEDDGTLLPGELLDASRVLCSLPPMGTPREIDVTVSLNNGSAGTFSADAISFTVYAPPHVASVTPSRGDAEGGTTVTVYGFGFFAISGDVNVRSALLRCRFGDDGRHVVPTSHKENEVVCRTPWGVGGSRGQPVTVSLNGGASFDTRAQFDYDEASHSLANASQLPRFVFTGTHPPVLLEAFFTPAATTLVVRFDGQPTNRAGMHGLASCAMILDADTAAALRGPSPSDALCHWTDDSTLVAYLTAATSAASGMRVGIRREVLWPREWEHYRGACREGGSKCALAASVSVSIDFPCDSAATAERELCVVPTALIQAPSVLDSCPGTSTTLDATRSSGGGVQPLSYSWSAAARECDNYYAVSSRLAAAGTAAGSITLTGTELDDGSTFTILLVVTNFLGIRSAPFTIRITRAAFPVPSISVQAPPLLLFPASASVSLEAKASIASCLTNASSAEMAFEWSFVSSRLGSSLSGSGGSTDVVLHLDAASSRRRDLLVRGSTLLPGVIYQLRVLGCMLPLEPNSTLCSSHTTEVALRDEPLQGGIAGGDRTVGVIEGVTLDACASRDPDEPTASCDATSGECGEGISFQWSCAQLLSTNTSADDALAGSNDGSLCGLGNHTPPVSACVWSVEPGALLPGRYAFRAVVSKLGSTETVRATVVIVVKPGALPAVSIALPAQRKQNPTAKLALYGQAALPYDARADETVELAWTVDPSDLPVDLAGASSTGASSANLVVLKGMLTPGATYTFTLIVTFRDRVAEATSTVLMNRGARTRTDAYAYARAHTHARTHAYCS